MNYKALQKSKFLQLAAAQICKMPLNLAIQICCLLALWEKYPYENKILLNICSKNLKIILKDTENLYVKTFKTNS